MNIDSAAAILISGLVLGSIYGLMATGLSLVWGTLRIFNFAHGFLMTAGAYAAWTVTTQVGTIGGLFVGIVVAIALTTVVGVVMERLLVRPVLPRPGSNLIAMVTTLAGATFGQQAVQLIWGPRFKQLPEIASGSVTILGTGVSGHNLVVVIFTLVSLLSLRWFLVRTDLGVAIRAVRQNSDHARLVGIDIGHVYTTAFAVAAMLAALAGVLLGGIFFMSPTMGNDPLLRAFIVVVFGGLGSLGGTIAGAYIIGIVEAASIFFFGLFYAPVVLFAVMIAVMLLRPQGLFGRATE